MIIEYTGNGWYVCKGSDGIVCDRHVTGLNPASIEEWRKRELGNKDFEIKKSSDFDRPEAGCFVWGRYKSPLIGDTPAGYDEWALNTVVNSLIDDEVLVIRGSK